MDEAEALAGILARGLIDLVMVAPAGEVLWTPAGAVAATDPSAAPDFTNTVLWGRADEATLDTVLAYLAGRRLGGTCLVSEAASLRLAASLARAGLWPQGPMPVMALWLEDLARPPLPTPEAGRVGDWPVVRDTVAGLLTAVFGFSLPAGAAMFSERMVADAGVDVFAARLDGRLASCLVTTRQGDTAVVWSMATDPALRRRGAATAALRAAIAHHGARGVHRFVLGATPAGESLYASLGFRVRTVMSTWRVPLAGAD